jgi:cytochrome c oxidase assembly factor CtaG
MSKIGQVVDSVRTVVPTSTPVDRTIIPFPKYETKSDDYTQATLSETAINYTRNYSINNTSDGQYIALIDANGQLKLSNDYGANFSDLSLSGLTTGEVVISSDGQYMTVHNGVATIYTSTDYGQSFDTIDLSVYGGTTLNGLSTSANGQYRMVMTNGSLLWSVNYGIMWFLASSITNQGIDGYISFSGKYAIVNAGDLFNTQIITTTNYGGNWNQNTFITDTVVTGVAISDNGRIIIIISQSNIKVYTDNGATLLNTYDTGYNFGSVGHTQVVTDITGRNILVQGFSGPGVIAYYSNDFGFSWNTISAVSGGSGFSGVAITASGRFVINEAVANTRYVKYSTNYGQNFVNAGTGYFLNGNKARTFSVSSGWVSDSVPLTFGTVVGGPIAISRDNTTMIIGSPEPNATGSAHVFQKSGGTWVYEDTLYGTDSANLSQGDSVAINDDGTKIAVGGSGGYNSLTSVVNRSGAVWIWSKNNGFWIQTQRLVQGTPPNNAGQQKFGYSLSMSGDGTVIGVGAVNSNYDNSWTGSVHIFRDVGPFVEEYYYTEPYLGSPPDTKDNYDKLGSSVAISQDGTTLAVGCTGFNGVVKVFYYNGANWIVQAQQLSPTGETTYGTAGMGTTVSISNNGNTLVAAGPYDNNNVGAAWVFVRNAGVWSLQSPKLVGSGYIGATNIYMGLINSLSMSQSGNQFVIGGTGDNSNRGAYWLFTRNGSTWSQAGGKNVLPGTLSINDRTGITALIGPDDHYYVGYKTNRTIFYEISAVLEPSDTLLGWQVITAKVTAPLKSVSYKVQRNYTPTGNNLLLDIYGGVGIGGGALITGLPGSIPASPYNTPHIETFTLPSGVSLNAGQQYTFYLRSPTPVDLASTYNLYGTTDITDYSVVGGNYVHYQSGTTTFAPYIEYIISYNKSKLDAFDDLVINNLLDQSKIDIQRSNDQQASYNLTWPTQQAEDAGQTMINDSTGVLTWDYPNKIKSLNNTNNSLAVETDDSKVSLNYNEQPIVESSLVSTSSAPNLEPFTSSPPPNAVSFNTKSGASFTTTRRYILKGIRMQITNPTNNNIPLPVIIYKGAGMTDNTKIIKKFDMWFYEPYQQQSGSYYYVDFSIPDGGIGLDAQSTYTIAFDFSSKTTEIGVLDNQTGQTNLYGGFNVTQQKIPYIRFQRVYPEYKTTLLDTLELKDNQSGYTTKIKTTTVQSNDITLTLPSTSGSNGQSLVTDGSGNLSWGTSLPTLAQGYLYSDGSSSSWDNTNVATLTGTQTLTNKTLTNPIIASILTNAGAATLTLPTQTDTLVGSTTNDTLVNKLLAANSSTYSTGSVSQTGYIVTGSGTNFIDEYIGGILVYANGSKAFIVNVASTTSLLVYPSQNVSSTNYVIYYGGTQLDNNGYLATKNLSISNFLTNNTLRYSVGTASQSGNTVTFANSALLNNSMLGGIIIFENGSYGFITTIIDVETCQVTTSQTVSSSSYVIYYGGITAGDSGFLNSSSLFTTFLNFKSGGNYVRYYLANGTGGTNFDMYLPAISNDVLVSRTSTDTLTNKTLTNPIISQISNSGTLTLPSGTTDTLVGRATTDTLTNKTLTNPIIAAILTNSGAATLTLPTSTDTLVGRATTDILTNKTLTNPIIAAILTNAGAATLTLPTSTDTLVGRATTDTLTNKTLTNPVIAAILTNSGAATLTLPTQNDTLVGRATTDTLTNKTLTNPIIASILTNAGAATLTLPTSTDTLVGRATTDTLTNKTLTNPVIAAILTNSGAATLTLPTQNDTLVGRATTDTLTNKTLTSPLITGFTAGGIVFGGASAGSIAQSSSNLFWDNTNTRLGIGTNTPSARTHFVGNSSQVFLLENTTIPTTNTVQASPLLQLLGRQWNSITGPVVSSAALQVTSHINNTNPTVSKLSFQVAAENAAPSEVFYVTSTGILATNGGGTFGSDNTTATFVLQNTTPATSSVSQPSMPLTFIGRAWNSILGNQGISSTLQLFTTTNNANPPITRLSTSIGGAEILSVSSNARVGINTTNPQAVLHLTGDSLFRTGTNSTTAFRVLNSSNIPIFNVDTTNGQSTTTVLNVSNTTNQLVLGTTNTTTITAPAPAASITLTLPSGTSDTLVGRATTDTLTNKTLTAPVISTITNGGGTLTLPSGITDTLVGRTTTDTLTNKTLTTPIIAQILTNAGAATLTLPTSSDTLVGRATTDTLTNKNLSNTNVFYVDGTDATKRFAFQSSAATNSTTLTLVSITTANRSITFPDVTDTLVGLTATQTLTNKTLTAPIISTITNGGGTLTLPSGTNDTLVGRATTDTLTNKTLTLPIISSISNSGILTLPSGAADTIVARNSIDTLTNKSLSNSTTFFVDATTASKRITFDTAGSNASTTLTIAAAQTTNKIVTFPDLSANDSFVLVAQAQTLTNKTLTSPIIASILTNGGVATLTLPAQSDTLVGRATTDTLSNKTLTLPTIASINNGGTISIPTGPETLVARATTDTLTNKSLTYSQNYFADSGGTRRITFDHNNQTANTTLTIRTRQTTNQLLDIPDVIVGDIIMTTGSGQNITGFKSFLTAPGISSIINNSNTILFPTTADTLVGRATTDTLSNKTLTTITTTSTNLAIGNTASAGTNGISLGNATSTSGTDAIGIGNTVSTTSARSISLGSRDSTSTGVAPSATGITAVAIGSAHTTLAAPSATGLASVAIGSSDGTVAGAQAAGTAAIALGAGSNVREATSTAIGYRANTANSTGTNIIALGQNAGLTQTGGSNNIFVGSNADDATSTTAGGAIVLASGSNYSNYQNIGNRQFLRRPIALTNNTTTTIMTFTVPQSAILSAIAHITVLNSNATNRQLVSESVKFGAINDGGTVSITTTPLASDSFTLVAAGTLTLTYTMTSSGTNPATVNFQINANSSLTNTLTVRSYVVLLGDATATISATP